LGGILKKKVGGKKPKKLYKKKYAPKVGKTKKNRKQNAMSSMPLAKKNLNNLFKIINYLK